MACEIIQYALCPLNLLNPLVGHINLKGKNQICLLSMASNMLLIHYVTIEVLMFSDRLRSFMVPCLGQFNKELNLGLNK